VSQNSTQSSGSDRRSLLLVC